MNIDGLTATLNGADLLDELRAALARYVVLPSTAALDAVTLYIAATHAQTAWEHASRLVIKSPLRRCGKTRLLEVVAATCYRPLQTTNISPAALVRSIPEDDPPTIIIDEADTIFAKRRGERSESAEDLRGIVNSGHSRGWPYIRWNMTARQAEECPTYAMAVVAAIGDLPDTIEDRAIVILMQRRGAGEEVSPFRRRKSLPELHALRARLHAWVASITTTLAEAEPDMPVDDRAADVWESLIAVADAAGGGWPAHARNACIALTAAASNPDDGSAGERLLADLLAVFGAAERMSTEAVLSALRAIDEGPWADWFGHPFRSRDLAVLLRPYGVRSKKIRIGAESIRGYEAHAFRDAWARYTRAAGTSGTFGTSGQEGAGFESEPSVPHSESEMWNTSGTRRFESAHGPKNADVPHVPNVPDERPGGDFTGYVSPSRADLPTCPVAGCGHNSADGKPCWRHAAVPS